jgi:hypothetical protein
MSRLLPAPDAAEPYVTEPPGNLLAAPSSTPDSRARKLLVGDGKFDVSILHTRVADCDAVLWLCASVGICAMDILMGVEILLGLLGTIDGVLAFVLCRHD